MLFLTLNNSDIQFVEKILISKSYTNTKVLPTTKQVELINKKRFAKMTLKENSETFVVHMGFLNLVPRIYLDRGSDSFFVY